MLRKRRKRDSSLAICAALLLSLPVPLLAQERPPVPLQYGGYFFKYTDQRSVPERLLNIVGMTNEDVGRSFALLCDISEYPNMSSVDGHLPAAAEDIRKLKEYLEQNEFFDEIVVLENEQVTTGNLEYFLQAYFADRLERFPKSRFLFAYSGHGMTENNTGYLLKSTARNMHDRRRAIKVDVLKNYIDEVVKTGHHILVLLNSCYSGTFLRRSFGKNRLLPQYPGAHAITAGGSGEAAWHDGNLGLGSVFYEKVLAGLHGRADRAFGDNEPDGIITAHELGSYLIDEIRFFSEQKQNPQMGDITQDGSRGEFFFLRKGTPLVQREGVKVSGGTSMGGSQQDRRIGQYIDHGNGTVTDTKTSLMWKRCSEGLSGDNCEHGKAEKYTWDEAKQRFKNVDYAGYSDWRIPTIDELRTLIYCSKGVEKSLRSWCKDGSTEPTINQQAFPNTVDSSVWSGSPFANDLGSGWGVYFNYGHSFAGFRNAYYAVRLVRGGK
ncbi:MAG: DUF1566 domain-containing protein [Candidatus Electrothrix sp. AU1_5]|nr:DUF1566 domain-containing protein [Candidatus Electrothrix gigas]